MKRALSLLRPCGIALSLMATPILAGCPEMPPPAPPPSYPPPAQVSNNYLPAAPPVWSPPVWSPPDDEAPAYVAPRHRRRAPIHDEDQGLVVIFVPKVPI